MQEFKNFDELERYLLINYNITMTAKVKQLHFKSVQKTVAGIIDTIDKFPQLMGQIKKLDTWHNNNWIVSCSYDGTVYFSLNRYNKIMPIKTKKLNSCMNGHWYHPINTDFDSLGSHECGHMLIKAYIEKKYPEKSANTQMQIWKNSSVAKDILNDVAKITKVKLYNLQKEMCSYANENASECIAECISDYMTNGNKAQKLSIMVAEYFKYLI